MRTCNGKSLGQDLHKNEDFFSFLFFFCKEQTAWMGGANAEEGRGV